MSGGGFPKHRRAATDPVVMMGGEGGASTQQMSAAAVVSDLVSDECMPGSRWEKRVREGNISFADFQIRSEHLYSLSRLRIQGTLAL